MENKVKDIQAKDTVEKRRKRLGGFSFIEVMVVIIILGLLSSIVGVYLFDSAEQAKADRQNPRLKDWKQRSIYTVYIIPAIPHQNRGSKPCSKNRK